MVKKILLLIFLGLIVVKHVNAQTITATASTDTTDYLVGDYIYFSIAVKYDNKIRVTPPTLTDNVTPLEVVKSLPTTSGADNVHFFNYILSGYDSARVVIKPIQISYYVEGSSESDIIETNPVEIFIHTLPVNPNADIKDIKAPKRIELDWLFWLILILGVLLGSLIAYFLYKKYKKPVDEEKFVRRAPPTPYHILALKELDRIKEKKLWQSGKVKEYHSQLTEVIRKYFEDRYGFNSLEMTTSETMQVLKRVMDNEKIIGITNKFLQNADMVKFAKFKPLPSVNEEMMNQAYEIIERTKPDTPQQGGISNV